MCGVIGFLQPSGFATASTEETLRELSATLSHRGPDDAGTWVDGEAGIALGHRRLAILDLTSAGQQPMISASGRYVIAFNGQIYNHLEIREELALKNPPPKWRGRADTETLLAAFDYWGIESTLRKCVGMFAIALWDREERILTLVRDRLGEKPLYYGWQNKSFLFGSELKALRAHPRFQANIDRDVLALYMRRGYIPAPHSIYSGIFKLPPGTFLQLAVSCEPETLPRPQTYWSLKDVAERGLARPLDCSDTEATNELESCLKRAVSLQSVADVPLGAFLSGGIDSSTIVALMQDQSSRRVKTFTIGFHQSDYNEAAHAKRVAQHLGTEHTELYVTAREAMAIIPRLPHLYDEPFGDSSAIPTFLVSELARQQVTVSLSGDGGDELFAGYSRYQRTDDAWRWARRVPYVVRNTMSCGLSAFARRCRSSSFAWKSNRLAGYLSARQAMDFYDVQISQRFDDCSLVIGGNTKRLKSTPELARGRIYDNMMYIDGLNYLPDDILAKVDRASMGVSLESRVPMLDHRVVDFAWQLPAHMKMRGRQSKWILRQVLRKYVPDSLVDRPKKGFGVPVGDWVREPLRDWAESLLSESRLKHEGFLNPQLAREHWTQHLNRTPSRGDCIWQLLMFQEWLGNVSSISSVKTR